VVDDEAALVEQPPKIIERQLRHALDVLERRRERRIMNFDSLEKGLLRAPAGDLVGDFAARDLLVGNQVLVDVWRVQVVEHQPSAGRQGAVDVADHDRMIARVFEVSEAGEQAEDDIKCTRAERLPHVLLDIAHDRATLRSRPREAAGRQVDTSHAETAGGETSRVAAAAATEVEHIRTASGLESIDQPIDEGAGFRLISVCIQPVVMGRIKPRRKPFRLGRERCNGRDGAHVTSFSSGHSFVP